MIVMERNSEIACFMLYFALCGASLINTPSNKAVIVGQRMEMECRTDNESLFRKWDFLQVGNKSPRAIATNNNKNIEIPSTISGYGIDFDHYGSVTLYSNSTETKNAGVYICQGETISGSTEFKYSAQLIVFESEPICETNFTANTSLSDGDYIWMQCRVKLRGNWAPTMEWRQHQVNADNDEGGLVSDETSSVVIQNTSITSTLIVLIDSTKYDFYYSCRTYFSWHNGRLRTNATNVPDFNRTWISTFTAILIPRPTTSSLTDIISKGTTAQSTIENTGVTTILLITGICLLVGLFIVATVGVVYCALLNRKVKLSLDPKNSTEVEATEYDLIPYACTDGYDTIEDVDEKHDILVTNFPPRHGPLPTPGYIGLMLDEPKPPGVYSRMDHKENSVANEKSDDDGNNVPSVVGRSKPDVEETAMKTTMLANSYLDLKTEIEKDFPAEDEEIPSAYLKITDDSLQFNTDGNVLETLQNEDSPYLELMPQSDKDILEYNEEIPPVYLKITDDSFQSGISDVLEANQEDKIPLS